MLVQVLVLNNINLGGYMNPYLYILFILLLPAKINGSMLLVISFLTGLTIDFFGNTPGLHSAACVSMAFLRPGTIKLLFRNYEFGAGEEPAPYSIGLGGFVKYSVVLVFVHQIVLFYLEVLSTNHFFYTLGKVFLSTLLSTFIIIIAWFIFGKRSKK
jgi:hypothetical protein